MILTGRRRRRLVLLAALLLAGSLALAQPRFRFNGRDDDELTRGATRLNNTLMAPARPFFNRFGANVERRGDWYVASRAGHEFRFRPGSWVWFQDDTPYYFHQQPYESNGALLLSIFDLIRLLGGRFAYDDQNQIVDIWYSQQRDGFGGNYYPAYGYGFYPAPAPVRLQVQAPNDFARVSPQAVTLTGYATPYADMRIVVYQSTPRGDKPVFDTPGRVDSSGQWSMRLPLSGPGTYKIDTQLFGPYGDLLASRRTTVFAQ